MRIRELHGRALPPVGRRVLLLLLLLRPCLAWDDARLRVLCKPPLMARMGNSGVGEHWGATAVAGTRVRRNTGDPGNCDGVGAIRHRCSGAGNGRGMSDGSEGWGVP